MTFESLQEPIKIDVPFNFYNFRAMVVQVGFNKSKFGDFPLIAVDIPNYFWSFHPFSKKCVCRDIEMRHHL